MPVGGLPRRGDNQNFEGKMLEAGRVTGGEKQSTGRGNRAGNNTALLGYREKFKTDEADKNCVGPDAIRQTILILLQMIEEVT